MTDYLTVVEVLAIHADQIERYGGASEIRDHGLLEAALYRPRTGYYADLISPPVVPDKRHYQRVNHCALPDLS